MQDHFMEEVVVKQKDLFNRLLYLLSWVIIILSGLSAMFMFSSLTSILSRGAFDWVSLALFLLSGGICAYTYFFHDRILTEYE